MGVASLQGMGYSKSLGQQKGDNSTDMADKRGGNQGVSEAVAQQGSGLGSSVGRCSTTKSRSCRQGEKDRHIANEQDLLRHVWPLCRLWGPSREITGLSVAVTDEPTRDPSPRCSAARLAEGPALAANRIDEPPSTAKGSPRAHIGAQWMSTLSRVVDSTDTQNKYPSINLHVNVRGGMRHWYAVATVPTPLMEPLRAVDGDRFMAVTR